MLQVRDPADVRSVVGEVPAITTAAGFHDAVRFAW